MATDCPPKQSGPGPQEMDSQSNSRVFPWANELYPPMQISGNYADQSASGFLSFTLPNYNDQYPVSAVVGSFSANSKGSMI